jgi:hypothetical protein
MGVICKICTHPEREAIEKDLLAGTGPQEVARRYKTSKHSVTRHRNRHLLYRPDPYKRSGPEANMIGLREIQTMIPRKHSS